MKLAKTRELRFNMGPYEHVQVSATVELDTKETDFTDQGATQYIDLMLDEMLAQDIERASLTTDNDESFVNPWKEITDGSNR